MNLSLTETEAAFRREVRAFLTDRLDPDLSQAQRLTTGVYPDHEISRRWHRTLFEKGWSTPLWPESCGGAGWSPTQRFIFEYESAIAYAPIISPFGVRLVGPVLIRYGTEAQQDRYLPGTASGDILWCQGFSEPNAGSDLASLRATATRDGDGYVVNGTKIWTTHAHCADMMFALLRTGDANSRHGGISFFVIDMRSQGLTVRPIASMTGEHELNQVFFDDVRIPHDALVGEEGEGWKLARYLLEFERGAGLFSARHRSVFVRLHAALTLLEARGDMAWDSAKRAKFGEVAIAIDAFEMLELSVLGSAKPGDSPGPVASMLKLRSSRVRQEIGQLALELLGSATLEDGPDADLTSCEDLLRSAADDYLDSRAVTIFGGASEVQLDLIARGVL